MPTTKPASDAASAPSAASPADNLLGICHTIGEAFGFDPLYLRIALGLLLLADFQIALIVYAALGVAVAAGVLLAGPHRTRRGVSD